MTLKVQTPKQAAAKRKHRSYFSECSQVWLDLPTLVGHCGRNIKVKHVMKSGARNATHNYYYHNHYYCYSSHYTTVINRDTTSNIKSKHMYKYISLSADNHDYYSHHDDNHGSNHFLYLFFILTMITPVIIDYNSNLRNDNNNTSHSPNLTKLFLCQVT